MARIAEYLLVFNANCSVFEEQINSLIKKGWQPFGDISTCKSNGDGSIYKYQPMVRYDEPAPVEANTLPAVKLVEGIISNYGG